MGKCRSVRDEDLTLFEVVPFLWAGGLNAARRFRSTETISTNALTNYPSDQTTILVLNFFDQGFSLNNFQMENNRKGNTYALVTGATNGIGYELAKLLAKDGHNLILVARTETDLQQRASEFSSHEVEVITIAKDLFDQKAAFELYDEIKSRGLTVSILVNDAGQGQYGFFIETDIQRQLAIIQLNISSLTALTYLILKDMVVRNEGKVLQLASIGSDIPGPFEAVYHATKAYVLSFTEALVNELRETNVTMTALQPGVTDTDFFNKAGAQKSKLVEDKSKMADPAKVAQDGYDALMKGEDKIVSGMKNKALVGMSHITPDPLLTKQMHNMAEEVDEEKSE
jgi:short-subunit dehydrogenase